MADNRYVLDANVFLEYIVGRSLQDKARQILLDAILGRIQILVPSLLLDEITEVLCGYPPKAGQIRNIKMLEMGSRKKKNHPFSAQSIRINPGIVYQTIVQRLLFRPAFVFQNYG